MGRPESVKPQGTLTAGWPVYAAIAGAEEGDPPVSVPSAAGTIEAATAQPAPLLEPPQVACRSHGFRAEPNCGLVPVAT